MPGIRRSVCRPWMGCKPRSTSNQTAQDSIEGRITLPEAACLIESYYRESEKQGEDRTQEADQVSARIAMNKQDIEPEK